MAAYKDWRKVVNKGGLLGAKAHRNEESRRELVGGSESQDHRATGFQSPVL